MDYLQGLSPNAAIVDGIVRFVMLVFTYVGDYIINKMQQLNSSTKDELGEGAWKDSGASSTRAERVGQP